VLEFVVHAALAIGAFQVLVIKSLCLFARSSSHRGFAVLEFVVHAALAIGPLQVLVIKSLCLFASCSCHRGFAGA